MTKIVKITTQKINNTNIMILERKKNILCIKILIIFNMKIQFKIKK